jgi:hypothetical protein
MENNDEWKVVRKSKQVKVPKNIIVEDKPKFSPKKLNPVVKNQEIGDKIELSSTYVLWCHDIYNKDWSLSGYTKLCTISTVSEFWQFFNNMDKIGYKVNNFFLMKDGTDPTWEHVNNRDGGICSFRTEIDSSLNIYQDLCVRMVCDILTLNMADINGISFSPKNNWAIIKIWNKDKHNDLSKTLDPVILDTYKDASIKYKENEPEY